MKSGIDIKDIAKYTILRLTQQGQTICPLKLQKILYYIQAWHFVYFDANIFGDNDIPEAWVNGPVYRCVYDQYKHIPIYNNISIDSLGISPEQLCETLDKEHLLLDLDKEQNDFLSAIFMHYGSMSHDKLVYLTHSEKPWNAARIGLDPIEYSNNHISLEEMKSYYSKLYKKNNG